MFWCAQPVHQTALQPFCNLPTSYPPRPCPIASILLVLPRVQPVFISFGFKHRPGYASWLTLDAHERGSGSRVRMRLRWGLRSVRGVACCYQALRQCTPERTASVVGSSCQWLPIVRKAEWESCSRRCGAGQGVTAQRHAGSPYHTASCSRRGVLWQRHVLSHEGAPPKDSPFRRRSTAKRWRLMAKLLVIQHRLRVTVHISSVHSLPPGVGVMQPFLRKIGTKTGPRSLGIF